MDADEPPLTLAPVAASPPKCDVPPETLMPEVRPGVEAVETTSALPPLEGVRKQKVPLPPVSAYHVLELHEAW